MIHQSYTKNETGFSPGHKEATYIYSISHEHLYPYLDFEYKSISERLKETKILIPSFTFHHQNVKLREIFEEIFFCIFRTSGTGHKYPYIQII